MDSSVWARVKEKRYRFLLLLFGYAFSVITFQSPKFDTISNDNIAMKI